MTAKVKLPESVRNNIVKSDPVAFDVRTNLLNGEIDYVISVAGRGDIHSYPIFDEKTATDKYAEVIKEYQRGL